MSRDEQIADLEEEIRTMQFKLRDAEWTLSHEPEKIQKAKDRLEELKKGLK